jgi:hypothetical protein
VIVIGNIYKVWFSPSVVAYVETIDIQFNFVCGGREGAIGGGVRRGEILDWVIEREVLNHSSTWNILLNLGDEEIMFSRCNLTTLFIVEVIIIRETFNVII